MRGIMKINSLRWGLLSTARINHRLIPPLRSSKRSQLAAVASRSSEKAEAYAREWNIPKAYGSYEELLHDSTIDAIYNPLPNHLHAEWTIRAAQAGKHVLCEKPLALSVAEVDAMQAAAEQAGVVVAEAFMYRHHPKTLKVKELIESGRIGEVWYARGSFSFFLDRPKDVRLDPTIGGGSLWDVGCYPVSYTRFVLGLMPQEVFGWQTKGPTGVDETFSGQMRFPGGILSQFDSSFRIVYRTFMEFGGSEGVLQVSSPFLPGRRDSLLITPRKGQPEKVHVSGPEAYSGEVTDMEQAVLDGKPPRISLADSRENTEVLLALYQSADEGRPVSLLSGREADARTS